MTPSPNDIDQHAKDLIAEPSHPVPHPAAMALAKRVVELLECMAALKDLIGGKNGEICEFCGIDVDTVIERLMQAQERNNGLSLELMKRRREDIETARRLLQPDQGAESDDHAN